MGVGGEEFVNEHDAGDVFEGLGRASASRRKLPTKTHQHEALFDTECKYERDAAYVIVAEELVEFLAAKGLAFAFVLGGEGLLPEGEVAVLGVLQGFRHVIGRVVQLLEGRLQGCMPSGSDSASCPELA